MTQEGEVTEQTELLKVPKCFEKPRSGPMRFSKRHEPLEEAAKDPVPDPEARKEVNRCSGCKRKVGLAGFRCRCGDLFCSVHRYSDRHECGFDYKAAGRAAIARENPVVRPAKILKV